MSRLRQFLPGIAVIVLLIAAWWLIVTTTRSVIFPTPWQVVTGTVELIRDGTLWLHIGASLGRVGAGFAIHSAERLQHDFFGVLQNLLALVGAHEAARDHIGSGDNLAGLLMDCHDGEDHAVLG